MYKMYVKILKRRKPYTLFVPSNEAFDNVDVNTIKNLITGNKCGLGKILFYLKS